MALHTLPLSPTTIFLAFRHPKRCPFHHFRFFYFLKFFLDSVLQDLLVFAEGWFSEASNNQVRIYSYNPMNKMLILSEMGIWVFGFFIAPRFKIENSLAMEIRQ